ncbi:tetratricopeptide repeat protein [Nocardioidaceae bacterium]|nr:tetratricopeptide repeat protein [Nocardioidaceae bacterium]
MSQQPFMRPGAVDLSALKRPATPPPGSGGRAGGGAGQGGSYATEVTEQNFQALVESSMTAPVVLAFHSPSQSPASTQLADDVAAVAEEFDGRLVVGRVDVDAVPSIAQAMQIPSVPLVVMVLQGRPMPLLQDPVPMAELRTAFSQVLDQIASQGMTGRHQPFGDAAPAADDSDEEGPTTDPRYLPAQEALERNDLDTAVAEYEKLLADSPADAEAVAGLAMARVLQRTADADLNAAREAAAANPDDIDAQTLVADLDLLGGHVEDAFARLIGLVARTSDKERDQVREHLVGLFNAVGNDDPRVRNGRMKLASTLF